MRFLSVCSGIEAASVAWQPLGWKAVAFSEIEPFPCAVLAHHYPGTPNWGDMIKFEEWPDVSIDLLCGGTPCQSFSVAGLRKGLADPRGNLMLTYGAIAAKYRPKWLVWENVPGVLSSNGGADFGAFLGMLGQLGYGFAYRVLDAQYFGVAQRRRRVFVVGCLGDWRSAAAVLFERDSLQGNPAPRRQAGQKPTGTLSACTEGGGGLGTDFELGGGLIAEASVAVAPTMRAGGNRTGGDRPPGTDVDTVDSLVVLRAAPHAAVSPALKARDYKGISSDGDGDGAILVPMLAHSLRGEGFDASEDGTGRGTPLVPVATRQVAGTLTGNYGKQPDSSDSALGPNLVLAFPERMSATQCASTRNLAPSLGALNPTAIAFNMHKSGNEASSLGVSEDRTDCLLAFEKSPFAVQPAAGMAVRRLTPRECERLQSFPDNYTAIPHRGKPAADGPRYKALGNSWCVNNVRWIGQRIDAVAAITERKTA